MTILALRFFFLIALFGVTFGRISFSCKKIDVDSLRLKEKLKCRNNHIKLFFTPQDKTSREYKCCKDYIDRICDNKIFIKCLQGSPHNQQPLKSNPACRPATELDCSKNAEKDWFDEDDVPKKNGKSTSAKKSTSKKVGKNENPGGSNTAGSGGSRTKTKNSRAELRPELLLIFALFSTYFM